MKELFQSEEYLEAIEKTKAFPWEDLNCYSNWLSQTFAFVSHTPLMLKYACSLLPKDDPIYIRCKENILEEEDHEKLILDDLDDLSTSLKQFPELATTKALYQRQYYLMKHVNPRALLGNAVMLESLAAEIGDEIYQRLKTAYPYAKHRFVKVHAHEDKSHMESNYKTLDILEDEVKELITQNFKDCAVLYRIFLEETAKPWKNNWDRIRQSEAS